MVTANDRVKLIHEQSERLKEYLDALSPEALSHPSACEEWTVADVVGHLAWAAEGSLAADHTENVGVNIAPASRRIGG